jgi:archaellum component FlaG (FlaF/FlaG flagellin family)
MEKLRFKGIIGMAAVLFAALVAGFVLTGCFSAAKTMNRISQTIDKTMERAGYEIITDLSTIPAQSDSPTQFQGVWRMPEMKTITTFGVTTSYVAERIFDGNTIIVQTITVIRGDEQTSAMKGVFTATDNTITMYDLQQFDLQSGTWKDLAPANPMGSPRKKTYNYTLDNNRLVISDPKNKSVEPQALDKSPYSIITLDTTGRVGISDHDVQSGLAVLKVDGQNPTIPFLGFNILPGSHTLTLTKKMTSASGMYTGNNFEVTYDFEKGLTYFLSGYFLPDEITSVPNNWAGVNPGLIGSENVLAGIAGNVLRVVIEAYAIEDVASQVPTKVDFVDIPVR